MCGIAAFARGPMRCVDLPHDRLAVYVEPGEKLLTTNSVSRVYRHTACGGGRKIEMVPHTGKVENRSWLVPIPHVWYTLYYKKTA